MSAKLSRRSLLKRGAAGAAVAAIPAFPATASADQGVPDDGFELATVSRVASDGRIELRTSSGSELFELDPIANEVWIEGDEVIVLYDNAEPPRKITDIQRMYRGIEDQMVTSRDGDIIFTNSGSLQIRPGSEIRDDDEGGYAGVAFGDIKEGDVVSGLGHSVAGSDHLAIDQLGVKIS